MSDFTDADDRKLVEMVMKYTDVKRLPWKEIAKKSAETEEVPSN
jgi:hypothetical protein